MKTNYRLINIFVSHPFEPKNITYDLEKFRTNIRLLISQAENLVRKEYKNFEIEITFEFNDLLYGLPQQIENKIRKILKLDEIETEDEAKDNSKKKN